MGTRHDARSLVTAAFPGHDELIDRGLRDHRGFRDLCEDYRRCASAIERWKRANGAVHASRRREYEDLLAELAQEVEGWIEALESEAARPDRTTAK